MIEILSPCQVLDGFNTLYVLWRSINLCVYPLKILKCQVGKGKANYYDMQLPSFVIEVREAYYQRDKDKYGRIKQARIGQL